MRPSIFSEATPASTSFRTSSPSRRSFIENASAFCPAAFSYGRRQQYGHFPRFPLRPFSNAPKRQSPEPE